MDKKLVKAVFWKKEPHYAKNLDPDSSTKTQLSEEKREDFRKPRKKGNK
jgi:hypothetical protein